MRQPPSSFRSRSDLDVDGIKVELWNPLYETKAVQTIASFYQSTWDDPISVGSWYGSKHRTMKDAILIAQDAMSGKVLPNTLESISLTFSITGISRATTHQLVRSRVGAVFGQQGGRDNNWSNFNLRIPPTFGPELAEEAKELQKKANELYQKAIKNPRVPYQDARYILSMGLETSLVAS